MKARTQLPMSSNHIVGTHRSARSDIKSGPTQNVSLSGEGWGGRSVFRTSQLGFLFHTTRSRPRRSRGRRVTFLLLLLAQASAPAAEEPLRAPSIVRRCDRTGDADEVVVCGRRDEAERYRLPIRPEGFDKNGPVDSVSRERHRLYEVGETGLYSCSNVGPGGYTGCAWKEFKGRLEQHGK
jgi:hypothetical protein